MNHEQQRHEKHEHERKEKQAHERQVESDFSKPGRPSVRPVWFLVIGIVLSLVALVIWMQV
jgi:fatty acid desaturase